jgi:hypothetical protein
MASFPAYVRMEKLLKQKAFPFTPEFFSVRSGSLPEQHLRNK